MRNKNDIIIGLTRTEYKNEWNELKINYFVYVTTQKVGKNRVRYYNRLDNLKDYNFTGEYIPYNRKEIILISFYSELNKELKIANIGVMLKQEYKKISDEKIKELKLSAEKYIFDLKKFLEE